MKNSKLFQKPGKNTQGHLGQEFPSLPDVTSKGAKDHVMQSDRKGYGNVSKTKRFATMFNVANPYMTEGRKYFPTVNQPDFSYGERGETQ